MNTSVLAINLQDMTCNGDPVYVVDINGSKTLIAFDQYNNGGTFYKLYAQSQGGLADLGTSGLGLSYVNGDFGGQYVIDDANQVVQSFLSHYCSPYASQDYCEIDPVVFVDNIYVGGDCYDLYSSLSLSGCFYYNGADLCDGGWQVIVDDDTFYQVAVGYDYDKEEEVYADYIFDSVYDILSETTVETNGSSNEIQVTTTCSCRVIYRRDNYDPDEHPTIYDVPETIEFELRGDEYENVTVCGFGTGI